MAKAKQTVKTTTVKVRRRKTGGQCNMCRGTGRIKVK